MKRIFNALGLMLVSALTLTNCTKNIDAPAVETEGVPFEIVASTVETKTVNDGMSTLWAAGDQINVFYAVGETADYVSAGAFTVNNVEEGIFTGTLPSELNVEEEYDWYAMYPYNASLATPKNTTVAVSIGTGLVQDGYNSTAHLAGEGFPLYGKAVATPGTDMPSVDMKQLASVLAVNVTNNSGASIEIEEVSFDGGDNNISGTFYVDFSDEKPVYKPAEANSVVTVTVENPTSLDHGETATVYLAIAPFSAYKGNGLTLTVNGLDKTVYIEKDIDFVAGKVKTLNFSYGPEKLTIAEFCALPDGNTVYEVSGVITGIYQAYNSQYNNISFYLKDATGDMVVYRMSCVGFDDPANTITPGDHITVQGPKGNYNGVAQMAQGGICVSHTDASDAPVITCVDNVVTITAEEGATIYYTTDGEEPTLESAVYAEPFAITESCTVSAIALADGKVQSPITSASCTYWDPNQELPEEASYTIKFGSNYNSKSVSSYTDTWYVTYEGFKCEMKNWNNNQNKWNYVKAGRKGTASVATITTSSSIPEAMTKVAITVDAVTASKINSLKLYVASGSDFANSEVYTATPKTGEVVFTITAPANNKYYKIEVDCASGSSNGLFTVSQVVYSNF